MTWLGGTDKIIVGDQHSFPQIFDIGYDSIHICQRGLVVLPGDFFNLLPMFICPSQIEYIIALHALKPSQTIGGYRCICMPDMKVVTGIINRCGNIICFSLIHTKCPPWNLLGSSLLSAQDFGLRVDNRYSLPHL